jgi:hypothetical protein
MRGFGHMRDGPPLLLVLPFACLLLLGCGAPDVLVLSDQYWWATDLTDGTRQGLVSRGENTRLEFGLVGFPTSPDVLMDVVERSGAAVTLLSPLLSQYGAQLARKNEDRRFVAFESGLRTSGTIDNLYTVSTDRSDAYTRAGALCRSFLEDPANAALKVAALFYSGGARRSSEREAFLNGIGAQTGDRLIVKSFPRLDGVAEVNEAVSSLKESGIGLAFVSMSSMTKDVVSNVSSNLQSFIISEWAGGASEGVHNDRLVAAIQELWLDAVDGSLKSVNSDIMVETVLVPRPAGESLAWFSAFRE